MKGKTLIIYRIFSVLMLLIMVITMFGIMTLSVSAANVTKTEKNYDIAVVFDNSGSMYQNQGWCRAKYAMEIFASMLNYDKDKLHIFPMWEVTTDGSQPDSGGSYADIEVKSKKDIDKISNLYTVHPSNTPFAPISEAYDYLKASGADEKWLIILTDGAFNQETRGKSAAIDLQKRVSSLASKDIKVQYLGIGEATALQANEANNFYAKKSSDTSLKDDLIGICNSIFQRSILENRLSGEKLNLDLSMKNLIVFAQGANAKITSLKDSNGKKVEVLLDSGQRKYSNIKARGYGNAPVDTSLAGQVVTFATCPKGEYTLSYSGTDKIQIFYEPDVDIDVSFVNSDGQKIDNPDDFVAGEYTVTSKIVDASTGEDVTSHELMGNNVKLNTYVKTSKDLDYKEYANGSKIVFEPDEKTEVYIEGEYLGKYKISSKDDPKLKWLLSGFKVQTQKVDFKIDATVLQSQSWYMPKDHENWKPVKVSMTLDGQPLTDEQLANVKLNITPSKNLKYRCEPIKGESAYNIYIAQDESGQYLEPETGKYKLDISATYTDKYGEEIQSKPDSVSFEIQKYHKILRILFWIIIILVLLAIWLICMLQKSLPKSIIKDTASFTSLSSGELGSDFVNVEYRRKVKSLDISGPPSVEYNEQCSASFDIRAVDNHFTSSRRRRIAITGIDSSCDEVKIAGTKYVNYDGRWIKANDVRKAEAGKEIPPIDQVISCGPHFELSRSGLSTLTCKTKTIK